MKVYSGVRTKTGCVVTVDGHPLSLRLDLENGSPLGFEWGYGGAGPQQLALAILADHLNNDNDALNLMWWFYQNVIKKIPHKKDRWEMTSDQIEKAIDKARKQM